MESETGDKVEQHTKVRVLLDIVETLKSFLLV